MKTSQMGEAEVESLCAIAPRRLWHARTSGMYQEYMQSFPQYSNQVPMQNIPNPPMSWQSWSTPQTQNQLFNKVGEDLLVETNLLLNNSILLHTPNNIFTINLIKTPLLINKHTLNNNNLIHIPKILTQVHNLTIQSTPTTLVAF